MAEKNCIIRVRGRDSVWSVYGTDQARGIYPEKISLTADKAGPKSATFELKRSIGVNWPDVAALSPIEVEIDGKLVWSGRILEAPLRKDASGEEVINVQCEGWQAHLDDDVTQRYFIDNGFSNWFDARNRLTVPLGAGGHVQAGQVNIDAGLTLMFGQEVTYTTGDKVSAMWDAGPGQVAHQVQFALYTSNNNTANFVVCSSDQPTGSGGAGSFDEYGPTALTTIGAGPLNVSEVLATKKRYLYLCMYWPAGATPATDSWVRVLNLAVAQDETHWDGSTLTGASTLPSHVVLQSARSEATQLLHSSDERIDTASFYIPDWRPTEPRTPREVGEALNAFEDRKFQVDAQRRLVFEARPTVPLFEVNSSSAMSFDDASANSSGDIYSRVLVRGTDNYGQPYQRWVGQAEAGYDSLDEIFPTSFNGGFETDVAGWGLVADSNIFRVSGAADTGSWGGSWQRAAGGGVDINAGGGGLYHAATYTFLPGVTYIFRARVKRTSGTGSLAVIFGKTTVPGTTGYEDAGAVNNYSPTNGVWNTVDVAWTPELAYTTSTYITFFTSNSQWDLDSMQFFKADAGTVVNQAGMIRTKVLDVSFTLTIDSAYELGLKYLQNHREVPFRGGATLYGSTALRDIKTGTPAPLENLLYYTDEPIRFANRIDPATGNRSRDGRLTEVTYNVSEDSAQISIDSSRTNFEALLNRISAVLSTNS